MPTYRALRALVPSDVPRPRRLFFTGAVDNDWAKLANWSENASNTRAAIRLPLSIDRVVSYVSITTNSGAPIQVASLSLYGAGVLSVPAQVTRFARFGGTASNNSTVTGPTRFIDAAANNGTVTGDAEFEQDAVNGATGSVTGAASFSGTSACRNNGTVTGAVVFLASAQNTGTITGSPAFNGSSGNSGTITGNPTFNSSAQNTGTITGNPIFNGNQVANTGSITGNPVFANFAVNYGTITGDAIFNSQARNFGVGVINGNPTFNATTRNDATVNGNATFNGDAGNFARVNGDVTFTRFTAVAGVVTTAWLVGGLNGDVGGVTRDGSNNVITAWVVTSNSVNNRVTGNITLNGQSTVTGGAIIAGDATFNGTAQFNGGTITGLKTFNASARNTVAITAGPALIFNDNAYNSGVVSVAGTFNGAAQNRGTIGTGSVFNDSARNARAGVVSGNATFNNNSGNLGSVTGSGTFNNAACQSGTVTGAVIGSPTTCFAALQYSVPATLLLNFNGADDSTTFTDSSPNAFAFTRVGDARLRTANPKFGASSGFFDGTGDYIESTLANAEFNVATIQNFTLEAWVYPISQNVNRGLFGVHTAQGDGHTLVYIDSQNRLTVGRIGIAGLTATGVTIPGNTWTHIAITREATAAAETRMYINGVLQATGGSGVWSSVASPKWRIGFMASNSGSHFNGYIDDFMFVRAVYPTGTLGQQIFTPPAVERSTPSSFSTPPSLLFNFNGANDSTAFRDLSPDSRLVTVLDGPVTISTAQSKFGGSSAFFPNTSSRRLAVEYVNSSSFLSGDFTIECWVYKTVSRNGSQAIVAIGSEAQNRLNITVNAAQNILLDQFGSGSFLLGANVPLNTWMHIAVTRQSGLVRLFQNGVQTGSVTRTTTFGNNGGDFIGNVSSGTSPFVGHIDDVRVVKAALYTSNFTPPTAQL